MDEGWRGSNRKIEMMGFAALYPSYGLRATGYYGLRAEQAREWVEGWRGSDGRVWMMGFAALSPSYGLRATGLGHAMGIRPCREGRRGGGIVRADRA